MMPIKIFKSVDLIGIKVEMNKIGQGNRRQGLQFIIGQVKMLEVRKYVLIGQKSGFRDDVSAEVEISEIVQLDDGVCLCDLIAIEL